LTIRKIRRLIGASEERLKPVVRTAGVIARDGYRIEKLVIEGEDGFPLPSLLFVPDGELVKRPATIYADGRGKARDAGPGGELENRVRAGHIVLSIDVRGFGETADRGSEKKFYNTEYRVANLAMHLGRPLLGQRVDDILAAADMLAGREDVGPLHLVGIQRAGPVALHAEALDERFSSVTLRESIASWVDDVVGTPLTPDLFGHVVPGALLKYDLPDLAKTIAPRKVVGLREPQGAEE
jgi:hypothetical protein